jgi:hypothetical protein
LTVTVQKPDAGMVAPASATLAPPLAAVTLPPAQVVAPLALAVLTSPAGYASLKSAPVIAVALVLLRRMVSSAVAFGATPVGAKVLVRVGRASTVRLADAAGALPALALVMTPLELR